MRSDARRRGDGQGHTRARICEKSLMRTLGPLPARPVPSRDLEHQGKLAHGFTGELSPQPQTTISNSKYGAQILRGLTAQQPA